MCQRARVPQNKMCSYCRCCREKYLTYWHTHVACALELRLKIGKGFILQISDLDRITLRSCRKIDPGWCSHLKLFEVDHCCLDRSSFSLTQLSWAKVAWILVYFISINTTDSYTARSWDYVPDLEWLRVWLNDFWGHARQNSRKPSDS